MPTTIKASLHKAHVKPLMTEPRKPMAKIADGVQTAGSRRGGTGTAMAAKRVRSGGVAGVRRRGGDELRHGGSSRAGHSGRVGAWVGRD